MTFNEQRFDAFEGQWQYPLIGSLTIILLIVSIIALVDSSLLIHQRRHNASYPFLSDTSSTDVMLTMITFCFAVGSLIAFGSTFQIFILYVGFDSAAGTYIPIMKIQLISFALLISAVFATEIHYCLILLETVHSNYRAVRLNKYKWPFIFLAILLTCAAIFVSTNTIINGITSMACEGEPNYEAFVVCIKRPYVIIAIFTMFTTFLVSGLFAYCFSKIATKMAVQLLPEADEAEAVEGGLAGSSDDSSDGSVETVVHGYVDPRIDDNGEPLAPSPIPPSPPPPSPLSLAKLWSIDLKDFLRCIFPRIYGCDQVRIDRALQGGTPTIWTVTFTVIKLTCLSSIFWGAVALCLTPLTLFLTSNALENTKLVLISTLYMRCLCLLRHLRIVVKASA